MFSPSEIGRLNFQNSKKFRAKKFRDFSPQRANLLLIRRLLGRRDQHSRDHEQQGLFDEPEHQRVGHET